MNSAVELRHVTKRFRRGESQDSLRDLVITSLRRLIRSSNGAQEPRTFNALDDVSFQVPRGQAIGVIGPNGAGKSTILKLLSGILRPDAGSVSVQGRLAALIEVGAGFHGDLTGRENVFLNGTILGMRRDEIRAKLDAIVAFAGLERFMDMPVKRYSSGMYARLGFSIAAHVDPDVLLVDEVLSVGDAVFRLRCLDRMRQLVAGGTTLVFVTHDLDQMQTICRRAIVLQDGSIAFDGSAGDAVGHYMCAMANAFLARPTDLVSVDDDAPIHEIELILRNDSEYEVQSINPGEGLTLRFGFRSRRIVKRLICESNLRSVSGQQIVSINSGRDGAHFKASSGVNEIALRVESIPLAPGQYFWNVRLWDADSGVTLVDTPFRFPMSVRHTATATGILTLPHEWVTDHVSASEIPIIRTKTTCQSDTAQIGASP